MQKTPSMINRQRYHPLLHSIQDVIYLEDGREFRKAVCFANGVPVGGTKMQRKYSNDSSFDSDPYLNGPAKKENRRPMKYRFDYVERI